MTDSGILISFFGKQGTKKLSLAEFSTFLAQLHEELVKLEFAHYDVLGRGSLSPVDFAHSLVATADLRNIDKLLDKVGGPVGGEESGCGDRSGGRGGQEGFRPRSRMGPHGSTLPPGRGGISSGRSAESCGAGPVLPWVPAGVHAGVLWGRPPALRAVAAQRSPHRSKHGP